MRKTQTLCIFIMLLFVGLNGVYAQKQTAYEKKSLEIKKQYIKKIMLAQGSWAQSNETELYYADEDYINTTLAFAIITSPNYAESLKRELKQAEKLKTAVDFQRDKERKAKEALAAKENTDAGSITKNIKNAFEKWNQKGEFEKEDDYQERLKTKSQAAYSQNCIEQIKSKINYYNVDYNLSRVLSTYNTENESFIVTFTINEVMWQNNVNIPIGNAENFKKNWSDLKCKFNDFDWCFVENSLCPTTVTLQNGDTKYEFPLTLKNQSDISYPFDKFEIANPYLKGYVFKYSEAKRIEKENALEKQKLDALEIEKYNQKLDSVFNEYNRQLLLNPYNAAKITMGDYNKIENRANIEDNFNRSVNSIKSNFARINNRFKSELESQNPSEYCRIYYLQNPDKKAEADKMYSDCKCNYPQRVSFDIKFIKGEMYGCNCREKEYRKSGELFTSKDEFDSFYDKGDDVLQEEVTIREFKKQASSIEPLDFKDAKSNEVSNGKVGKAIMGELTGINVQANTNNKEYVKYYVQEISNYKIEVYYSKIIDFTIETNKGLNKEWTKNGQYFNNKVEFYEAYISGSYKQILSDKKG